MELNLPAPCVVVMIGPSGTGKSTWASDHFDADQIVSSDALRAQVGRGEDDMTASAAAFELLERITTERITRRLTTVIDTTGLDGDSRARWIGLSHEAGLPVYAVLFEGTPESIEPRNRLRARPVPRAVLRKQFSRFRETMAGIETEGFDGIHHHQPVRAVPPTLITATRPEPPPDGHTFGLQLNRFAWEGDDLAGDLTRIAQRAEEAGFSDLWLMDHFRQIPQIGRRWEVFPEAYTTLSYLAGVTTHIRLGVLVTGITHRHPVVLGKMLATLDVLSGGRAICGLGLGWDEEEHAGYGIEMPPVRDRYDILEDTLQMLPLLWGKGSPAFVGKTFSAEELVCYPRPDQAHIPIVVGGSGEKRTLRLVARYADGCNLFGDPATIAHKVEVLTRHCSEVDRDPGEIAVTNLVRAMPASSVSELGQRVDHARARSQSPEEYSRRNHAGLTEDLVGLFSSYAAAGASHSIVSIPDVSRDGAVESFGNVIATMRTP